MRAAGAPSDVTVATVMALASRGSLACASANHRENLSKGSLLLLDATSFPLSPPTIDRTAIFAITSSHFGRLPGPADPVKMRPKRHPHGPYGGSCHRTNIMRDPYAVLGVSRDASEDDIKRAYRRLAKKLHPDLSPGNRANEQQFKEVTAAYDLLSDAGKRARFDRGEIDAAGGDKGTGFRADSAQAYRRATGGNFSFEEIIAELLGRGRDAGSGGGGAEPASRPAQSLRLG